MGDIDWVGDSNGHGSSSKKRKSRPKRMEYIGWGSKQLIEFLQSQGIDTTNKISQFEVNKAVVRYISENGLIDSSNKKKKRVVCDEKLISLFGTKTVMRMKVYDLLEKHFEENKDDSEYESLYDDEPRETSPSEKVTDRTRKVVQKRRGTFAAVVSDNIKLVFLRKSLVEELVKSPESFESKMLGSFVRIKADPNDYLQKNPYQLSQVIGVKKEPGTEKFLLQVTNYMKDVSISMLSDDNFSQEECEDLHQRMKNGSLKKLTIVEMEEKTQSLHEDQTKHWLGRELALLQVLINQANEKGWRRELSEYLDKRQLLQNPKEQARLFSDVPEIIEEELVPEVDHKSDDEQQLSESPISNIQETPDISREVQQSNDFITSNPSTTPAASRGGKQQLSEAPDIRKFLVRKDKQSLGVMTSNPSTIPAAFTGDGVDVEQQSNSIIGAETPTKESNMAQIQSSVAVINLNNNRSQAQPNPQEIIELSDDEDEDVVMETVGARVEDVQIMSCDKEESNWLYKDPYGNKQGPFSLTQLKAWHDEKYFNKNFVVWKTGQSMESAVLLTNVLRRVF